MMYVVLNKTVAIQWHVGEDLNVSFDRCDEVTEVMADGHELELVKKICHNIPMTDGRVVRWFGVDAQFIVAAIQP